MTQYLLTAENVEQTFLSCLYKDGEVDEHVSLETLPEDAIITEGVVGMTAFNPVRIEENRDKIIGMLSELPMAFRADSGGGWSFLQGCIREDGSQWTGMHQTQDHLFQLGMAIKVASYPLGREFWSALPGSVPYIVLAIPTKVEAE